MKLVEVILSTTHIDRHNERMSKSALESMVEQIKANIIPAGIDHDPRIPPVGRIKDAKLQKRTDGEYEVIGIIEMFEPGDEIPLSNRRLTIRKPDSKEFELIYDRSYRNEKDQKTIEEIGKILDSSPIEESKKSYDVLSVLTIAGVFAAGAISAGFFNSLGKDAYDSLKKYIKELLKRKSKETEERLFKFNPIVEIKDRVIEIDIILTNPKDGDIDMFFEDGLKELDSNFAKWIENKSIAKLVFEYSDNSLKLKFGIRKDGVPMFPKNSEH